MNWEIEWDDGSIDWVESVSKPDIDFIESGIDADSPRFGHQIKKIKKVMV